MSKFFFDICITFMKSSSLIIISTYHILPHVLKYCKRKLIRLYIKMFSIQEAHELLTLRAIGYMDAWCLMNTWKYSCMKSHCYTCIQKWKYIECLLDSFRNIICSPCHNLLDIETIILLDISIRWEYEKYRCISLTHEKIIYLWKCPLSSLKKSTSYRYSNSFFNSWKCLDAFIFIEKYDIIHNHTRHLKCLKKSLTPRITNNNKVTGNKKSLECKFVLYLGYLETNSPK